MICIRIFDNEIPIRNEPFWKTRDIQLILDFPSQFFFKFQPFPKYLAFTLARNFRSELILNSKSNVKGMMRDL